MANNEKINQFVNIDLFLGTLNADSLAKDATEAGRQAVDQVVSLMGKFVANPELTMELSLSADEKKTQYTAKKFAEAITKKLNDPRNGLKAELIESMKATMADVDSALSSFASHKVDQSVEKAYKRLLKTKNISGILGEEKKHLRDQLYTFEQLQTQRSAMFKQMLRKNVNLDRFIFATEEGEGGKTRKRQKIAPILLPQLAVISKEMDDELKQFKALTSKNSILQAEKTKFQRKWVKSVLSRKPETLTDLADFEITKSILRSEIPAAQKRVLSATNAKEKASANKYYKMLLDHKTKTEARRKELAGTSIGKSDSQILKEADIHDKFAEELLYGPEADRKGKKLESVPDAKLKQALKRKRQAATSANQLLTRDPSESNKALQKKTAQAVDDLVNEVDRRKKAASISSRLDRLNAAKGILDAEFKNFASSDKGSKEYAIAESRISDAIKDYSTAYKYLKDKSPDSVKDITPWRVHKEELITGRIAAKVADETKKKKAKASDNRKEATKLKKEIDELITQVSTATPGTELFEVTSKTLRTRLSGYKSATRRLKVSDELPSAETLSVKVDSAIAARTQFVTKQEQAQLQAQVTKQNLAQAGALQTTMDSQFRSLAGASNKSRRSKLKSNYKTSHKEYTKLYNSLPPGERAGLPHPHAMEARLSKYEEDTASTGKHKGDDSAVRANRADALRLANVLEERMGALQGLTPGTLEYKAARQDAEAAIRAYSPAYSKVRGNSHFQPPSVFSNQIRSDEVRTRIGIRDAKKAAIPVDIKVLLQQIMREQAKLIGTEAKTGRRGKKQESLGKLLGEYERLYGALTPEEQKDLRRPDAIRGITGRLVGVADAQSASKAADIAKAAARRAKAEGAAADRKEKAAVLAATLSKREQAQLLLEGMPGLLAQVLGAQKQGRRGEKQRLLSGAQAAYSKLFGDLSEEDRAGLMDPTTVVGRGKAFTVRKQALLEAEDAEKALFKAKYAAKKKTVLERIAERKAGEKANEEKAAKQAADLIKREQAQFLLDGMPKLLAQTLGAQNKKRRVDKQKDLRDAQTAYSKLFGDLSEEDRAGLMAPTTVVGRGMALTSRKQALLEAEAAEKALFKIGYDAKKKEVLGRIAKRKAETKATEKKEEKKAEARAEADRLIALYTGKNAPSDPESRAEALKLARDELTSAYNGARARKETGQALSLRLARRGISTQIEETEKSIKRGSYYTAFSSLQAKADELSGRIKGITSKARLAVFSEDLRAVGGKLRGLAKDFDGLLGPEDLQKLEAYRERLHGISYEASKAFQASQGVVTEKGKVFRDDLAIEALQRVGGWQGVPNLSHGERLLVQEYGKRQEGALKAQANLISGDEKLSPSEKRSKLSALSMESEDIAKGLRVVNQEINGTIGPLRQISLAAKAFFRYFVLYGAAYGVVNYFRTLTATVIDFRDVLKGVQVVAEASNEQMVGISSSIRSVSSTTGASLREVASAAETLAQAGIEAKSIPAALKAVSDFALATGSSLETASDIITSAKEIFGGDMTFPGAADQLTRTVNISKLKAEDLRTIFNLGAQTAQASGMSSAQFLGASATLSNLGIKSSTVATGLRQLLLELFNPDEQTLGFLRSRYSKLGESMIDMDIVSRFRGYQKDNNPLLSALTELRRIGAAGQGQDEFRRVLDIRAENVALPLLRRLDELAKNTAQITSVGAASAGAEKRVDTLRKSLDALAVKAQLAADTFGQPLLEGLKAASDGVGSFIDNLIASRDRLAKSYKPSSMDLSTGVLGAAAGAAVAKRSGLGWVGRTLAALGGATAAESTVAAGEAKGNAAGGVVDALVNLVTLAAIFGKKAKDAAVPGQGAAAAVITQFSRFTTYFKGLWETLKAFRVAALGPLLTNPWTLVSLATVEIVGLIYDHFNKTSETVTKAARDTLRKEIVEQQKSVDALQAQADAYSASNRNGLLAEATNIQKSIDRFNSAIGSMFGAKADEAKKLFGELGDATLEGGTPRAIELKGKLQALRPGQPFSEQEFAKLTEAQAFFVQAQKALVGKATTITEQIGELSKTPAEKLTEAEKRYLAAYNKLKGSPLFQAGALDPEALTRAVLDLQTILKEQLDELQMRLEEEGHKLRASKMAEALAGVGTMMGLGEGAAGERQRLAELVTKHQLNPASDTGAQLQQYRAALSAQLESLPPPPYNPTDDARYRQLTEDMTAVDKALDTGKVAAAKATEQAAAERLVDQQNEEKRVKDLEELREKTVAADREYLALQTERNNRQVQINALEEAIATAEAKHDWKALLGPNGLIDQKYGAETKFRDAEEKLAAAKFRQEALSSARLKLPDLNNITTADADTIRQHSEVQTAYSAYLEARSNSQRVAADWKGAKERTALQANALVPFSPTGETRRREQELADLQSQLSDGDKENLQEALALQEKVYNLRRQQTQEELTFLSNQADRIKLGDNDKASYEQQKWKLEQELRTLELEHLKERTRLTDEMETKRLKAELDAVMAQIKMIKQRNRFQAQTPGSGFAAVGALAGRPPLVGGPTAPFTRRIIEEGVKQGLSPMAAAAMAGNFEHETDGFKALTPYNGKEESYGWAHWNGPRKNDFMAFAQAKGLPPDSPDANLGYTFKELQDGRHVPKDLIQQMNAAGSVEEATRIFRKYYERPGVPADGSRERRAKAALDDFNSGGPLTGYAPTSNYKYARNNAATVGVIGSAEGHMAGVDQDLLEIVKEAAKYTNAKVDIVSAKNGRAGGTPQHPLGEALDIQLTKGGQVLPNLRDASTFRDYEEFWQLAKAIQSVKYPERKFRFGGYFSDTRGDVMHGDVYSNNMGWGSWETGASEQLKKNALTSSWKKPGDIRSQGMGNIMSFAAQMEGLLPGGASRDIGSSAGEFSTLYARALQINKELSKHKGYGPEFLKGSLEELKTQSYDTLNKTFEDQVSEIRNRFDVQQAYVQAQQSYGLPSGPADTAARLAAGLGGSPEDEAARLDRVAEALAQTQTLAEQQLSDYYNLQRRLALELDSLIKQQGVAIEEGNTGLAELLGTQIDAFKEKQGVLGPQIQAADAQRNEAKAAFAANRQERQVYDPTLFGKDGVYGQFDQATDLKGLADKLNKLSYSFNKLGENVQSLMVNAIDTFVTTVANQIINGATEIDTAALQDAQVALREAQAEAAYQQAVKAEEARQLDQRLQEGGADSAAIKRRREALQSAVDEANAASSAALDVMNEQVRQQRMQAEQSPVGDAMMGVAKEGGSTLLKTAMLYPFQKILGAFGLGERGASENNPMYVKEVGKGPMAAVEGISGWFGDAGKTAEKALYGIGDAASTVGKFFGFSGGGPVRGPGTGTSDSIPAWLSAGEYVLTANEVKAIGPQNLVRWKAAMQSPAKFAAGGAVTAFDRVAPTLSAAAQGDSSAIINVIDQRSTERSAPIETNRRQGPNGKEVIEIMVRDALKSAINTGQLDRTMTANFGARRPGGAR